MSLIRNLLALAISIIILPICLLAYTYVSDISFDYNRINDEISLCQLREILLIGYDINVNNDQIVFRYKNKENRLSLVNNKLILQPGTQIFLNDIDDIYFYKENGCVKIRYYRNNKYNERIICSEKRFYIDDFSDCDVLYSDNNNSEE